MNNAPGFCPECGGCGHDAVVCVLCGDAYCPQELHICPNTIVVILVEEPAEQ